MNRQEHIKLLEHSLEIGLGSCVFKEHHTVNYVDKQSGINTLNVDLFEENNKLIIFLDEKPVDDLQADLINSGYVPIAHILFITKKSCPMLV